MQIMAHSARTFSTPRSRNWRKPTACLFDLSEHRLTTCFLNRKAFRSRRRRSFCASVASAVHQLLRLPPSGA